MTPATKALIAMKAPRPPVHVYPINFTLPARVLRDVLTLESVEALELARAAGLEKR